MTIAFKNLAAQSNALELFAVAIPAIGTDDNIRIELARRELIRFVVNDASLGSFADLFGANSDSFY